MTRIVAFSVIGLMAALAGGQTPVDEPRESGQTTGAARPAPENPRSAESVATLQLLNARLGDVAFDEAPLEDIFAWLGEAAGTSVVVRWRLLEDLGIERDKPVSISARNLRLSQILWLVMNEAAVDGSELAYRADSDLIVISTAEDIGRPMVVRVYHVRDLTAPQLRAPEFISTRERETVISTVPTVASGAVAVTPITRTTGSGIFFGGEGTLEQPRQNDDDDDGTDPEAHLQKLIEIITTVIEPDSWAVNGGTGTISSFRGRLVVRNSPLVHQKIGGYLRSGQLP